MAVIDGTRANSEAKRSPAIAARRARRGRPPPVRDAIAQLNLVRQADFCVRTRDLSGFGMGGWCGGSQFPAYGRYGRGPFGSGPLAVRLLSRDQGQMTMWS
jgi:hypothetical protein